MTSLLDAIIFIRAQTCSNKNELTYKNMLVRHAIVRISA